MKVLVVDDSNDISRPVCRLLEIAGAESRSESNGMDAIATTKEWKPDCILLDIMMPGRDGLEVLRHLRADGYTGYIAMMTAISDPEMATFSNSLGADKYIIKGNIDLVSLRELLAWLPPLTAIK